MSASCQHDITHVISVSSPSPFLPLVHWRVLYWWKLKNKNVEWGCLCTVVYVYIHKSWLVLTTVNWEKLGVKKIFCCSSWQRKLNAGKIFASVNLRYNNKVCDVCAKTVIWMLCSWLCSLLIFIHNVNLKLTQGKGLSSGFRTIVVNMSAKARDPPAYKTVKKVIMDEGPDNKCGQYFIFMIALDAASSFVLFHAAWSLARVGN